MWWPPLLECHAVTLPRTQDLATKWILHLVKFRQGARNAKNVYICTSAGVGQTSCKVWLASVERCHCSNEANMQNPLKFAGVPQTRQPISAAKGPKFTILWGHVEEILLFKIFFRLSIHALVAKILANKVVRWCPDGQFLAIICVVYFQRAACSTFQTCILNSH